MQTLWQDMRYAARMLLQKPGFTFIAVFTLALGIGANTAIFSIVNAVLLNPLPFDDPRNIVFIWQKNAQMGFRTTPRRAAIVELRKQAESFAQIEGYLSTDFTLTGAGEPERLQGTIVSTGLFPLLRTGPKIGRGFLPEEGEPGANRVIIISHRLWQRAFGADPAIEGKTLTLDGQVRTVLGVMPAKLRFPSEKTDLWIPMAIDSTQKGAAPSGIETIARIRPGVSVWQAQAEIETLSASIMKGSSSDGWQLEITLPEEMLGERYRIALTVLLGAVGLVLLIACANVSNLLLARGAARQKEIAIRAALGASRFRLARQLLTESLLLAVAGGAFGLLIAAWSIDLISSLRLPDMPLLERREIGIDGSVLAFTAAVSLLSSIIFGLFPALQVSSRDLLMSLTRGVWSSSSTPGRSRVRNILVIAEVALSLVLLVGAGLLINSFIRLRSADNGFNSKNLLAVLVELPDARYRKEAQWIDFFEQLQERLRGIPGVESAAMASSAPPGGGVLVADLALDGRQISEDEQPGLIGSVSVDESYFRAMGIPILSGRAFTAEDHEGAPDAVIISESFARRYWPDENPVGKTLRLLSRFGGPAKQNSIVGVARDVNQMGFENPTRSLQLYFPFRQSSSSTMHLLVRVESDPMKLVSTIKSQVWTLDKELPIVKIVSVDSLLSESLAAPRFNTSLLGIFAALALLLAAVGLYGSISYSVSQQTREFGIRMALGADRINLLKMVLKRGLMLTLIGLGLGLAGSLALTRFLSSLLYGVSATDPATFVVISLLLAVVALTACWVPARRATRVDPMVALRYE